MNRSAACVVIDQPQHIATSRLLRLVFGTAALRGFTAPMRDPRSWRLSRRQIRNPKAGKNVPFQGDYPGKSCPPRARVAGFDAPLVPWTGVEPARVPPVEY